MLRSTENLPASFLDLFLDQSVPDLFLILMTHLCSLSAAKVGKMAQYRNWGWGCIFKVVPKIAT